MALAPRTVRNMPDCLRRNPITLTPACLCETAKFGNESFNPAAVDFLDQLLGSPFALFFMEGNSFAARSPRCSRACPMSTICVAPAKC